MAMGRAKERGEEVNKTKTARIGALLENYQTNCMYSCIEFKGVDCVNSTRSSHENSYEGGGKQWSYFSVSQR